MKTKNDRTNRTTKSSKVKIIKIVSRRPPPEVLDGWEKDREVKAQKAQKAMEDV